MEQKQRRPNESMRYAQAIAEIVRELQLSEAVQVYNFALSLQTIDAADYPQRQEDDWLNDSEDEMAAEDAQWDATLSRHSGIFNALAFAAQIEVEAGITQPMFDKNGELITDELPYNA